VALKILRWLQSSFLSAKNSSSSLKIPVLLEKVSNAMKQEIL
jgi:hypothetical protein